MTELNENLLRSIIKEVLTEMEAKQEINQLRLKNKQRQSLRIIRLV